MTRPNRDTDKAFDAIITELEPMPVTTHEPPENPDGMPGAQDVLELSDVLSFAGVGPATFGKLEAAVTDDLVRTSRGAIAWGRDRMEERVAIFHGLCLMFVRLCFNVDPLAPDAITAWESARTKNRCTPAAAPRGHAGFFRGGEHGHVVLCLGNGRCLSTDTVKDRPGSVNVATLEGIEQAWGYVFLGTTSDLNGENPVPRVRASKKRMTDRQWRIRHLRRALRIARGHGNASRAHRLKRWLDAIIERNPS